MLKTGTEDWHHLAPSDRLTVARKNQSQGTLNKRRGGWDGRNGGQSPVRVRPRKLILVGTSQDGQGSSTPNRPRTDAHETARPLASLGGSDPPRPNGIPSRKAVAQRPAESVQAAVRASEHFRRQALVPPLALALGLEARSP